MIEYKKFIMKLKGIIQLYDSSKNILGEGFLKVKFNKKGRSKKSLKINTTLTENFHGKVYYGLKLPVLSNIIVGFQIAGEVNAYKGDIITVVIDRIIVK